MNVHLGSSDRMHSEPHRSRLLPSTAPLSGIACGCPLLLLRYAKYQGQAGRVVGIPPGEAWRVALRAAVAAGASQASVALARPSSLGCIWELSCARWLEHLGTRG